MKYVSKEIIDSEEKTRDYLKNLSSLELSMVVIWSKGEFLYGDPDITTISDMSKFHRAAIRERDLRKLPILNNLTEIDLYYKLLK